MARIRRIVHPTDFSKASLPAFRKALELAKANNAALPILHVLPSIPMVADAYMAANAYDELLRGQRAQADKSMARLVTRARAAGVRAVGKIVDFGVVSDASCASRSARGPT